MDCDHILENRKLTISGLDNLESLNSGREEVKDAWTTANGEYIRKCEVYEAMKIKNCEDKEVSECEKVRKQDMCLIRRDG